MKACSTALVGLSEELAREWFWRLGLGALVVVVRCIVELFRLGGEVYLRGLEERPR
jgi:hypothetical protein